MHCSMLQNDANYLQWFGYCLKYQCLQDWLDSLLKYQVLFCFWQRERVNLKFEI